MSQPSPQPVAHAQPWPSAPPDRPVFVVHTDRASVHRWRAVTVVANVFLGLLIVVWFAALRSIGSVVGWWFYLPVALLLINQFFQVAYHAYAWGVRATIATPLEVLGGGIRFHLGQGQVDIPWAAMAEVRTRRRIVSQTLLIRLRSETLHLALINGVPATSKGILRRRLLYLGSRGIREDLRQLLAAIDQAAAGRVRVG